MVRYWLLYFGPSAPPWSYLLRKDFGHVMAAGYDDELKLWVFVDPKRQHTLIEIFPSGEEVDKRLGVWTASCKPNILRIEQRRKRRMTPAFFSCVGAIKALVGVRCWAATPRGLYRSLVRQGAEIVEVPDGIFQSSRTASGRSQCGALAA